MTTRKFYKRTVTVTILSEDPIPTQPLERVAYEIVDGSYSGMVEWQDEQVLDGQKAAEALIEQDSDPEFFRITEDGEDV